MHKEGGSREENCGYFYAILSHGKIAADGKPIMSFILRYIGNLYTIFIKNREVRHFCYQPIGIKTDFRGIQHVLLHKHGTQFLQKLLLSLNEQRFFRKKNFSF